MSTLAPIIRNPPGPSPCSNSPSPSATSASRCKSQVWALLTEHRHRAPVVAARPVLHRQHVARPGKKGFVKAPPRRAQVARIYLDIVTGTRVSGAAPMRSRLSRPRLNRRRASRREKQASVKAPPFRVLEALISLGTALATMTSSAARMPRRPQNQRRANHQERRAYANAPRFPAPAALTFLDSAPETRTSSAARMPRRSPHALRPGRPESVRRLTSRAKEGRTYLDSVLVGAIPDVVPT